MRFAMGNSEIISVGGTFLRGSKMLVPHGPLAAATESYGLLPCCMGFTVCPACATTNDSFNISATGLFQLRDLVF